MRKNVLETTCGNIYYWTSGQWNDNKKTVFFFHGLTADHRMFDAQIKAFEQKYNLIVWDAPGHGLSKPFRNISMQQSVDAIKEILNRHSIKSFVAVGQSLGGYFPQALMCRNSELVDGFIGIGATPYGHEYYSKSDFFWLRQVGWMCMCYPWKSLKKASAKGATCTQRGFDNMMEMLNMYTHREYALLMQAWYDAMMEDNQDYEAKCPVLITRGEFDKTGKVKKYCEMWHAKTGSELVIISGAGHNANVDNPELMNRTIEDFIEKID